MPKKLMWNDKGLKGNGIQNPRQDGDDLVVDEVQNGLVAPRVVGNFRGAQGLHGADGIPTGEAFAQHMTVPGPGRDGLLAAIEDIRQGIVVEQMPGATDSDRWDAALNRARATGKRVIYATRPNCTITRPIDVGGLDGLVTAGVGGSRLVQFRAGATEVLYAFTATSDVSNVSFEGFSIIGTAADDVTAPRRGRTYSSGGFQNAFSFYGDLVPGSSGATPKWPRVENVSINNVHVYGTRRLPVFFTGIRGKASITNSTFDNCYDVGFTFCESAHFINNRVTRSADNGVSLSRGNRNIVCVGNSFEMCAYWAIWIGGFRASPQAGWTIPSTPGPERVIVTGNVAFDMGYGGVSAQSGPKVFNITGNTFQKLRYSPLDENQNMGVGIYITSHEVDAPLSPASFAQDFQVHSNLIVDAARGGIFVPFGAHNGSISYNTIIRPGSAFKADGTTPVPDNEVGSNFGIYAHTAWNSTMKNIAANGNVFIDDRSTVLLNYPIWSGGLSSWSAQGNTVLGGSRQALRENTRRSVSGPAGVERAYALQTDGKDRFAFLLDTAAETGSDAGSTMQAVVFGDDGTTRRPAFVVTRSSASVRFVQPPRMPTGATSARPTAFAAGSGAIMYDTTLGRLIVSNGSEWRDFAGSIV